MPTNLSVYPNCSSKSIKLFLILLLFPVFFHGQTLTGLWTGALSNDSTTVRQDQSFEIALTEYKGKVYGYSRSEFIVDDVLYYVVKRVKGTIEGDICEVEDDEIIAFNFPRKLDKGIKVTSTFKRNKNDGVWQLDGTWKTNSTKKYYAVTGKVGLAEEKDLTASKIFPHLEELKLANNVAFYKERQDGIPIVKIAKPQKIKTNNIKLEEPLTQHTGTMAVSNKPAIIETAAVLEQEELPSINKSSGDLPKTNTNTITENIATVKPSTPESNIAFTNTPKEIVTNSIDEKNTEKRVTVNKTAAQEKREVAFVKQVEIKSKEKSIEKTPVSTNATVKKATSKVEEKTIVKSSINTQKETGIDVAENKSAAIAKPIENNKEDIKTFTTATPLPVVVKKTREEITQSAAIISGRKSEFSQEVNYESDSLVLSLYDNGEIDGDTVSVFMNGEMIMAKQGLKASAIKKTIYISPETEDFSLVLFAENLGKYPPNTGLLVVHDGDEIYNLRFSSDFQKNSGIIFRRKNKN